MSEARRVTRLRLADSLCQRADLGPLPPTLVDLTRPHVGFPDGRTAAGGEGHVDLLVNVPSRLLSRALDLRARGQWLEIEISGQRTDGSSFAARDVVLVQ